MPKPSRREFLRATGAGAGLISLGAGAGALLWPHGRAAAHERAFTTGAIIFMLNGGARTQAIFNGSVAAPANPFNPSIATAPGDIVPLSPLMAPTAPMDDRLVAYLNKYINLIATCQHHKKTGSHSSGRIMAATGRDPSEQRPGILSILNREFSFRPVPCVNVGPGNPTTTMESDDFPAPIEVSTPQDIGALRQGLAWNISDAENARLDTLRYAIEEAYYRGTPWIAPEAIPVFQKLAKKLAYQAGQAPFDATGELNTPFGRFLGRYDDGIYLPSETTPAVTNGRLRAMCGAATTAESSEFDVGTQAVLAVRLRQLGCAGITISSPESYDLHHDEGSALPPMAARLAQAIAGLIRALSDIADPHIPNATLLDTTIITFASDFSRGNWGSSGFDAHGGSDHLHDDKTATQCIPIIGGKFRGKVLGSVDSVTGGPASGSKTYQTRQVLATVLEFVGVPPELYLPEVPTLTAELLS